MTDTFRCSICRYSLPRRYEGLEGMCFACSRLSVGERQVMGRRFERERSVGL